ncbi:glycosyltransferase [Planosporangium sp. 12N6]|uniref:glycosyltransferase n=1 Tax=Planosporangium spinosum TaxID=3402278 RepID=UPI003CF99537
MTGLPRRDLPLRIVLVVGTLQVGGTETQLVKLASGLRARGHDVHVIALLGGGPLAAPLRAAGVETRIFAFGAQRQRHHPGGRSAARVVLGEVRELYRVWRHLRALRPDVCHAFLYTCNTLVLPLAWLARVPLRVAGRRGPDPELKGLRHRTVEAIGRRAASVHLCNSRAGAAEVVSAEGVPASRVLVIANGVEIPEAVAQAARQPAHGVVVAQLRPGKGHEDLLAALASLPAPPRVCLIGDGPQRRAIEEQVDRLGLAGVVQLAGERSDVRELLPAYQFAMLPSHGEGLPNAVLEAMAAGLPVIATAVGGVPDVVVDGVTGILVPPRAPDALAVAIAQLADDPDLRVRLGAAARAAAMDFSVPACVNRHEAIYRQWLP